MSREQGENWSLFLINAAILEILDLWSDDVCAGDSCNTNLLTHLDCSIGERLSEISARVSEGFWRYTDVCYCCC